jgi:hypothetical protein
LNQSGAKTLLGPNRDIAASRMRVVNLPLAVFFHVNQAIETERFYL